MSKTTLYDVRSDGKAHVIIAGRFEGAGSSAPEYPIANPPGWTVARASAGTYTLTLTDQYAAFICCTVSLEADTANDVDGWTVITQNYTDGATPTLTIEVSDAATATDLPADCFVNFVCILRNTTVAQ
jgi:hypothetical protein